MQNTGNRGGFEAESFKQFIKDSGIFSASAFEPLPGIEVSEATPADWLLAQGPAGQVPRCRGEKVVQLRAAPPASWGLA